MGDYPYLQQEQGVLLCHGVRQIIANDSVLHMALHHGPLGW